MFGCGFSCKKLLSLAVVEQIEAIIHDFAAHSHRRHVAQWLALISHHQMPIRHTSGVEQIWRQPSMAALDRIALDVRIGEQPLFRRFIVAMGQSDDDDMDMRLAARLAAPAEGAVGEHDFETATIEQDRPQLGDLLAPG